jgi:ubiquinone/menaquinone biosynthesis C-methylase UbiE
VNVDEFAKRAAAWDLNPQRQAVTRAFMEAALGLAPDKLRGRVLDFGAGTGLLGLRMAQVADHVDLQDTSAGMLAVLRGKIADLGLANVAVHEGELLSLGLPEASYDAIITSNVLHHVEDIAPVLARFRRLAAPGGVVLAGDVELEDGSFHAPAIVPHNGFDPSVLARRFESAGFRLRAALRHHVIRKPDATGRMREYPQFLICAVAE